MKLTKRAIDAMTYAGAGALRDVRWDADLPGFGVRIYPTGRKAFVLSYRAYGRKRLMTLSDYGVLTLEQAQSQARKHLVAVGEGDDPLEARRKERGAGTVADLCHAYLERHARLRKKTWRKDESRIHRHLLPVWGNLKAKAITRADVAALHRRIGKDSGPYEANRTLELLSVMFELAVTWGFLPEGSPNPARRVEAYKEEKRDRWVTPEELPRLAQAIDQEPNPYARAALWLYLLTGVRKTELLTATWSNVSWDRKELKLPETKAGRAHYLPLSEPALALLQQIPRLDGNPYILPGLKEGRHLVNIEKPWRRARKAAGVEDVRLHDIRRTVGSWLAQAGNSLHLIGRVLNHSNQSTTAIYARFAQDHVREALEAHGKRIMGVAGKLPMAEVLPLRDAL
jgi:Site-specific recombinase XerD